ncbi:homocysteine S-methyltransferase family protein [Calditrichota bacterium]
MFHYKFQFTFRLKTQKDSILANHLKKVLKNKTLVSDGAMGTLLHAQGLPIGHCPEEWNISHPEVLTHIHKNYYDAGADIVETNTFGGSRYRLRLYGFEDKVYEFNKQGAALAKAVCPAGKFVAGSVGPTGEFLQPLGITTFEEMEFAFSEQIQGLIDGGVDVLFIETMSYVEEIKAAVNATVKINPDIPMVCSMSFEKGAAGFRTMMGTSIKDMVNELADTHVTVIGANCGKGTDEMVGIMKEFRHFTDMPLLAQANAGLPETLNGEIVYSETAEQRGQITKLLLKEKVNIIGGCCGTTPAHISAIRHAVDSYQK